MKTEERLNDGKRLSFAGLMPHGSLSDGNAVRRNRGSSDGKGNQYAAHGLSVHRNFPMERFFRQHVSAFGSGGPAASGAICSGGIYERGNML